MEGKVKWATDMIPFPCRHGDQGSSDLGGNVKVNCGHNLRQVMDTLTKINVKINYKMKFFLQLASQAATISNDLWVIWAVHEAPKHFW